MFDGLTGLVLTHQSADSNELSSLPPRIFEKLTGLTNLALGDNPGSARFAPIAKAGPAGGIEVVSGGSVTLGVEGAENGHDDPWGTNVTWAWSRTGGAGGSLTDAAAARATFTAPVTGEDGTHVFRLKPSSAVGNYGRHRRCRDPGGGGAEGGRGGVRAGRRDRIRRGRDDRGRRCTSTAP